MLNLRINGVYFLLEGLKLDKLIDDAAHRGVCIDEMTRPSHKVITGYVSMSDYTKIKDISAQHGLVPTILRPRGLYALILALKKRWSLVVCAVIACFAINHALGMVWSIDVLSDIDADLALNAVKNTGLYVGMPISDIDRSQIEDALITTLPDVAYVGVRTHGTCLRIEVVRAKVPPNIAALYPPCDIVAVKDCVIESIRTLSGKPLVKPGDTVRAGQTLISGIQRTGKDTYKCVRAMGEVKGRVWYSGQGEAYFAETTVKPTGRIGEMRTLRFFSDTKPLSSPPPFETYAVDLRRVPVGGLFIPISVHIERRIEMQDVNVERGVKDARDEAAAMAELNARAQCPDTAIVVDKWTDFSIIEGEGLRAQVVFEAIEPVGRTHE